jgi:hypothetical protein
MSIKRENIFGFSTLLVACAQLSQLEVQDARRKTAQNAKACHHDQLLITMKMAKEWP